MAFKQVDFARLARFNSANSCDFLEMYEHAWEEKIARKNAEPKKQTIAPSAAYCQRYNWFRLRGVETDKAEKVDKTLDFTAQLGTACHETIQSLLKETLGDDWLDVGEYLASINPSYKYTVELHGFESRIEIEMPPVRFACDGIIMWKGKIYLLEIKTSEFNSWDNLTAPKPIHIDQVKYYATLLGIHNVLMLYQDRQYGGLKCFEIYIDDLTMKQTSEAFDFIVDMAHKNLPPNKLPSGDSRCSSSMCPYYNKCKEW